MRTHRKRTRSYNYKRVLNEVVKKYRTSLSAGLYASGLALQTDAQKRSPVDTGALRASAETRRTLRGVDKVVVSVGFSARYALYVHENVGANFKVGQAKFLEEPARLMETKIGEFVRTEVRKGKA